MANTDKDDAADAGGLSLFKQGFCEVVELGPDTIALIARTIKELRAILFHMTLMYGYDRSAAALVSQEGELGAGMAAIYIIHENRQDEPRRVPAILPDASDAGVIKWGLLADTVGDDRYLVVWHATSSDIKPVFTRDDARLATSFLVNACRGAMFRRRRVPILMFSLRQNFRFNKSGALNLWRGLKQAAVTRSTAEFR